jgi:stearoyl-CoA 9-desaturase NADPH oxidoreductase
MEASARALWARARDAASPWVELVDPLATTHVRHARVENIEIETSNTRTLTLRPGAGWRRHRPGQYVEVGVEVDGRIVTRPYSISSTPDREDGLVTITVTAIENGRASNALARRVSRGDYLRIGLPKGEFTMPARAPERVLFVTGGSGVTPVMSMLRTFAEKREMPDVVHVHYARTRRDVIFARDITWLARDFPDYRPTIITTHEGFTGWQFGRETLDALAPDFSRRAAWACGPEPLLEAVCALVPEVRTERFRPRLALAPKGACGGRVRFARSQRELDAGASTPLLELAERAGVNAPHGCRMGICHSCDATMIEGAVRDLRTGKRIDEPGARIQPCVCAAAGDVEIDL